MQTVPYNFSLHETDTHSNSPVSSVAGARQAFRSAYESGPVATTQVKDALHPAFLQNYPISTQVTQWKFRPMTSFDNVMPLTLAPVCMQSARGRKKKRGASQMDISDHSAKKPPKLPRFQLSHPIIDVMAAWFEDNRDNPYPNPDVIESFASTGLTSHAQALYWFDKKRKREETSKLLREQHTKLAK